MAKTQIKRMDWFKWFPRDIQTSLNYQMMSPAQRGAYRDMLDRCWINFEKGCGIKVDAEWLSLAWGKIDPSVDEGLPGEIGWRTEGMKVWHRMLAQVVNIHDRDIWADVMPTVLRMFRVSNGLLINDRLMEQVNETLEVIGAAGQRRLGSGVEPEPDSSGHSSKTLVGLESDNKIREDKSRVETETEVETENASVTVCQVFDQMAEGPSVAANAGRRRGDPGYFERGRYPGTSPKAVFSHIAKAWGRVRGESAICRYPSKYPQNWEMLCDQKSADLLVPAFELWATKEGYNTEWPLTEFIKVAQKYTEQVIPLNQTKPKVTEKQIQASYAASLEARNKLFDIAESKEPGPEAF